MPTKAPTRQKKCRDGWTDSWPGTKSWASACGHAPLPLCGTQALTNKTSVSNEEKTSPFRLVFSCLCEYVRSMQILRSRRPQNRSRQVADRRVAAVLPPTGEWLRSYRRRAAGWISAGMGQTYFLPLVRRACSALAFSRMSGDSRRVSAALAMVCAASSMPFCA